MLRANLATAFAGHGRLVLISGEAGVGKTAIAALIAREAASVGAHAFIGHCYDRTETPPYGAWLEIVRRLRASPPIADAPPIPHLETAATQAALFAQARDFLTFIAGERPVCLLLEDLHWADSASLDLLRFIAHGIDEMPLLLIATYRADELDRIHPLTAMVPLLVREAPTERLDLRPLDAAAVQALVRARYDLPDDETARLAAYLMERTEGNALFLTELLRALEEGDVLHRAAGRWQLQGDAPASVPRFLRQIIDARLTRLGDDADALLAVAAVIGHDAPLSVWQVPRGRTRRRCSPWPSVPRRRIWLARWSAVTAFVSPTR